MRWKKLHYWLKGGIIGAIVGGIIYLSLRLFRSDLFCVSLPPEAIDCTSLGSLIVISWFILIIIGLIAGFIVGKIKNKKKRK